MESQVRLRLWVGLSITGHVLHAASRAKQPEKNFHLFHRRKQGGPVYTPKNGLKNLWNRGLQMNQMKDIIK
jgi:hypothetical protein